MLQGYGDDSPRAETTEADGAGNAGRTTDTKEHHVANQECFDDKECSPERVHEFASSLPPFFKFQEESSRARPFGEGQAEQENEQRREEEGFENGSRYNTVDPNVFATVKKWIEMKEKGYTITQDLRKRNWYKSPDMMMSMLEKFHIDDRGTFLSVSKGKRPTGAEIRTYWEKYEERRKTQKEAQRSGRNIEFTRGDAVSAAVAAARAHAASFKR